MSREKPTIYSAPRRFDLATMLVITTAYAILFAGLKAFDSGSPAFIGLAGFLTFVGVTQSLLHSWQHPRLVSILSGMLFYCFLSILDITQNGRYIPLVAIAIGMITSGAFGGYFCGVLVGGVFLVSDYLRRILPKYLRRKNSGEVQPVEESPWDD